ncbi:MAG TPA: hypothetical protein GXX49_00740 [Clostridiaceae bacterium]|nr:hypothetical protein [Clostridiaceae bacterium]
MKFKLLASALMDKRNIGVLLTSEAFVYLIQNMAPDRIAPGPALYAAGFAVYAGFVIYSTLDKRFVDNFLHRQKVKTIKMLNNTCLKLFATAKKYTNAVYYKKLKKVMDDRNEIFESFFRGSQSELKENIVEKTLNLVVSYIKLLTNFCIRSRELAHVKIDEIITRLNENTRKINFINDPDVAQNISQMIELDRKIISRVNEEKNELEKIRTKLDFMESSIGMFKHQIISNIESSETLNHLDDVIVEAMALDSVLESRKKNRLRI